MPAQQGQEHNPVDSEKHVLRLGVTDFSDLFDIKLFSHVSDVPKMECYEDSYVW